MIVAVVFEPISLLYSAEDFLIFVPVRSPGFLIICAGVVDFQIVTEWFVEIVTDFESRIGKWSIVRQ